MLEEKIEIGIVGTSAENTQFTSKAFGHDEILLVARKGHHWYGRTEIPPADLLGEPIILRGRGSGTNDVAEEALRQLGIKISI